MPFLVPQRKPFYFAHYKISCFVFLFWTIFICSMVILTFNEPFNEPTEPMVFLRKTFQYTNNY